jgi:hypothetical protein
MASALCPWVVEDEESASLLEEQARFQPLLIEDEFTKIAMLAEKCETERPEADIRKVE